MRRLNSSQWNVLDWASRHPLRRVSGGWLSWSGDFVTRRSADSLMARGLLVRIHRPRQGPGLVLTAAGRAMIGGSVGGRETAA